jgi:16S rRNA processing protein RimM
MNSSSSITTITTQHSAKKIVIGKFGRSFGVHGYIKIHSFTRPTENFLAFGNTVWFIGADINTGSNHNGDRSGNASGDTTTSTPPLPMAQSQHWREITPQKAEQHGTNIIAKLSGVDSPEAARAYTNQLIAINRDQLPTLEPGEFYWEDLIGMKVVNKQGVILGTVDSLVAVGANDVLVVKNKIVQQEQHAQQHKRRRQSRNSSNSSSSPHSPPSPRQHEHFIPYIKQYIIHTDLSAQEIVVDWDEDF